MFCADWALSFALWSALATWRPSLVTGEDTAATILPAAVLTGAAATALLFPFDFVREGALPRAAALPRAPPLSTTAFTAVAFGTFWSNRAPGSDVADRAKWAAVATALGACAEAPLDAAKARLAGGLGRSLVLSAARVPLGAAMFFAVDVSLLKRRPPPR